MEIHFDPTYLDHREIFSKEELYQLNKVSMKFSDLKKLEKVLEARTFDAIYAAAKQEGNSYTKIDTLHLLSTRRTPDNQKVSDTTMLLNLDAAYQYILEQPKFNPKTLREIHSILSDKLIYRGYCGNFRNLPVEIRGSEYKPLQSKIEIEPEIDKLFDTYQKTVSPFDKAAYLNCNISYLQPFMDVNKRTAKLSQTLSLIKDDIIPLFIKEADNKKHVNSLLHYYQTGDYTPYKKFFMEAYREQMKELRQVITPQQQIKKTEV